MRFPLSRIGVKPIFFIQHLNTIILCSSRMASLSHRRCFRFFEKNFLRIFFNPTSRDRTEGGAFETTGNNLKLQSLIKLKLKLVLYLKRLLLFLNLTCMRFRGKDVQENSLNLTLKQSKNNTTSHTMLQCSAQSFQLKQYTGCIFILMIGYSCSSIWIKENVFTRFDLFVGYTCFT